jgi:hypothetical protein
LKDIIVKVRSGVSYSSSAAKRGITAITGVTTNGLHGRMNVADGVSYSNALIGFL